MKKSLFLGSILLFSMSILHSDISIKNGWQLLGATEDMNTSIFDNTCVDYIWKYDTTEITPQWKIHVANGTDYGHSMTSITTFSKGEGFWLKANTNCTVSLTDVVDPLGLFQSGESWQGLVYETVLSPFTGRIWLDRNLGASQICTVFNDSVCYGDYYQWGRLTDGHEKIDSKTTLSLASTISGGTTFIRTNEVDWTSADTEGALRNAQWNRVDGNSICPKGYRVPNYEELNKETILAEVASAGDAFSNFLKIPSAGYRSKDDASLQHQGIIGYVWTNQINSSSPSYSYNMYFATTFSGTETVGYRANAYPVRCIKN